MNVDLSSDFTIHVTVKTKVRSSELAAPNTLPKQHRKDGFRLKVLELYM